MGLEFNLDIGLTFDWVWSLFIGFFSVCCWVLLLLSFLVLATWLAAETGDSGDKDELASIEAGLFDGVDNIDDDGDGEGDDDSDGDGNDKDIDFRGLFLSFVFETSTGFEVFFLGRYL